MKETVYCYDKMEEEVKRHGYEIIHERRSIRNDAEYVVMAYSKTKNEYVTWLYVPATNGLFSGNYFPAWDITKEEAFIKAYADFTSRK